MNEMERRQEIARRISRHRLTTEPSPAELWHRRQAYPEGITQGELVRRLGKLEWIVTESTISRMENTTKPQPLSATEVHLMECALDLEPGTLTTGLGIPGETVRIEGRRAIATAAAKLGELHV